MTASIAAIAAIAGSVLLSGCSGGSSTAETAVEGVQVTRPAATPVAGAFLSGDEDCIDTELDRTLTVAAAPDGRMPKLQAMPVAERQKVADAYLTCEADLGLRSLVAAGLQVGNPAVSDESAECQSKALYDGLGRARFAALATSAIRLDDLSDAEVLRYQGIVVSCP